MTREQEAFDKVWRHFVTDGAPPSILIGKSVRCRYRGDGGAKCAVGVLIPDEEYEPGMEGHSATELLYDGVASLDGMSELFLIGIQGAHDIAATDTFGPFWEKIERKLRDVADEFTLTVPR
jgi:hypothetical protein